MYSNHKISIISLIIGATILIGGLFYIFNPNDSTEVLTESLTVKDDSIGQSSVEEKIDPVQSEDSVNTLSKIYNSKDNSFSFSYSANLNARVMNLDGFDVIALESHNSTEGFQIIVSPFPADTLKPADIKEVLGDVKIDDVRELTVGYKGKGFIFKADNPSFEDGSIEAWFVYDGKLYQVNSYLKNKSLIMDSLATWKFAK